MKKKFSNKKNINFNYLLNITNKHKNSIYNILNSLQISDNFSLNYLNYLRYRNKFEFLIFYISNLFKLLFYKEFISKINMNKKYYNKIYFTWGTEKNFDTKGNFKDNYLKIRTKKNSKDLIVILFLGKKCPRNINFNCILISKGNTSLLNFLKNVFIICKFGFKNLFFSLNYQCFLGINISKLLKKDLENVKFKEFVIPYEGSLSQKIIFYELRKINENLKISGIIHSVPQPYPINFLNFHRTSPDKLIVHSTYQRDLFCKYLKWQKNNVNVQKSQRYKKNKKLKKSFYNKIFLPYIIKNSRTLLKSFDKIKDNLNKDMEIKIHPQKKNDREHLLFSKQIERKISSLKTNNLNKNLSVFFNVSSSLFIAAEMKIKVIQIHSDEKLYTYDYLFWKGLITKKLDTNIIEYKKRGNQDIFKI